MTKAAGGGTGQAAVSLGCPETLATGRLPDPPPAHAKDPHELWEHTLSPATPVQAEPLAVTAATVPHPGPRTLLGIPNPDRQSGSPLAWGWTKLFPALEDGAPELALLSPRARRRSPS